MHTHVAIVGGGLSGLHAAYRLHQADIDFQLFEARERLGGRILSADAAGAPSADGFDLGPSWFWPGMHPHMAAVIRELGLPSFAQHDRGEVIFERSAQETPRRLAPMRQEPSSMRLAGGTGALIAALAGRLPEDRMHRQAQVTHLACSGHGAVLTYTDENGETQSVAAAQVILALPPRLLAETVTFEPALPPEAVARWRNTATWMAPHAKFFALYDRAFWRDAGLSGTAQSQAGPLVEIHDATTAAGGAALFGFVGLPADHRQTVGEGAMKAAAVAQLVRLFGPEAGSPRATLWKDWTADPLTATRADRVAGGHPYPSHQPWLTGPWAQHVVLGGSETSSSDPGYLAGALEAGGQAAQAVSRRLAEAPALAAARSAH